MCKKQIIPSTVILSKNTTSFMTAYIFVFYISSDVVFFNKNLFLLLFPSLSLFIY